MASPAQRLATNAPGEYFVDATCIDCDTCRWLAPRTFDRAEEASRVYAQPQGAERRAATLAVIACPTGSIGGGTRSELAWARDAFPLPLDPDEAAPDVFYCGWHAETSFGAASYLIVRPPERGGNVLVDSPRFSRPLVRRIEAMGGVATLFLTHKDDVADHERWHEHFSCTRVLHAADATARTRDMERLLDGEEPIALDAELVALPVPGHTRGSTCLLYRDTHLFTGDHLAWSEDRGHLYAFRSACWYDWDALRRSMERLATQRFEWVLPGHGRRARFPHDEMRVQMERCLEWLRATA